MPPHKPAAVVLSKLGRVRRSGTGWSASCPVKEHHKHGDKNPSLSVAEGADGRALVTCHTGCTFEEICAAVGLEPTDLFPPEAKDSDGRVCIAEYAYTDEEGSVLYVKERLWPKAFRQRRPDGKGGWVWNLGRTRRPLYRLPAVLAAKAEGRTIYFVEGERDVHSLEALGEVATTAGGVKDFKPEHASTLDGATVVVIADADAEGRKLATAVGQATGAPVMEPAQGKDVTEHLRAGLSLADLVEPGTKPVLEIIEGGKGDDFELVLGVRDGDVVVAEAPVPEIGTITIEASWIRRDRYGVHAETRISTAGRPLKQSVINLSKHEDRTKLANAAAECYGDKAHGPALRLRLDHFAMNVWEWWTQASGPTLVTGGSFAPPRFLLEPYVIEGGITMLYGPPKSGKSYVGLLMALTLTHGVNEWAHTETTAPVAFVNLERPPDTVGYRLQRVAHAVGCPASLVIQHEKGRKFADVAPSTIRWLDSNPGGVIVLDSLSRMGAGDLNSNEDTNRAMDLLHSLKASVVVLAHTPRADASHVFGSVMHDAAADVLVRCEKAKGLEPNLMGVRITVDDGNDVGWAPPKTWALEFERGVGLSAIRPAKAEDFPELTDVRPIRERAKEYLELVQDATTKDIADELDVSPDSVGKALKREPETFQMAAPGGKGKGSHVWWTLIPKADSQ